MTRTASKAADKKAVQTKLMRRDTVIALAATAYVAIVLIYDTLTMHQYLMPNWFDPYKFIAFLAIPFLICLPKMDWGYFGVSRWRRTDIYLFLGFLAIAVLAILAIKLFPSLQAIYPPVQHEKLFFVKRQLIHLSAWLIGWEFMHRYFLLGYVSKAWPKYGWLLVPLSESLYHLQKPPMEALGVALLMPIMTYWALVRRNALFPFLIHAAIEINLLIFQIL